MKDLFGVRQDAAGLRRRTRVKICGITGKGDAEAAEAAAADAATADAATASEAAADAAAAADEASADDAPLTETIGEITDTPAAAAADNE